MNYTQIIQAFVDLSFIPNLYIVGGAVRDCVMGIPINDIDVCSKHTPEEIISMIDSYNLIDNYTALPPEMIIRYYLSGMDHGTITIVVEGRSYEHTTFRKDNSCDGRHAEVSYTDKLEEDAARRDFTMNAMYMDKDLKIIDLYNGQEHIKDGYLCTVGNPVDRFNEDYLRIIRAFRFSWKYFNSYPSPDIIDGYRSIPDIKEKIRSISTERIVMEIDKAFKSVNSGQFIASMIQGEFIKHLAPELTDVWMIEQNPEYHPEIYVGAHIREVVERCDPQYRWHALFHDIGKLYTAEPHKSGDWMTFYNHDYVGSKRVGDICRRLKLPNKLTKEIEMVCKYHMKAYMIKKPSKLRRFALDIRGYEECIKAVFAADHPDNKWPDLPNIPEFPNGYEINRHTNIPLDTPMLGRSIRWCTEYWISTGQTDKKIMLSALKKHLVKDPDLSAGESTSVSRKETPESYKTP